MTAKVHRPSPCLLSDGENPLDGTNLRSILALLGAPLVVGLLTVLGAARPVSADEPPAAPPVSAFAPAADLVAQFDALLADTQASLESADDYFAKETRVRRNAHTLTVLALALALHDSPHRLSTAAPALIAASQALAATKDHPTAVEACAALAAVAEQPGSNDGPAPEWARAASLSQLMKQVTFVHNLLRRNLRGERFASRADENAQHAALLAVIAQAALVDTHEVKDPAQVGEWYAFSGEMRDAAGALNAAIHAADAEAAADASKRLERSCTACHQVFRPSLP